MEAGRLELCAGIAVVCIRFQEATMTSWHDTMVDRPQSDHEAGYAAGWTISGLAMLGAIVTVWVFAI